MDMSAANIEAIVKQVLQGMTGETKANAVSANSLSSVPNTAKAAVLTGLEKVELKEYPIPEIGDGDILVKVEGCGICGTDAHEYKRDPFGLIPVVLGHEGTGEIVKIGKDVTKDSAGKPLKLGNKVVSCMIFKDNPDITMFDLNKQNVGGADVYGLLPDDETHLNGWLADYIVIRKGSTIFNVSDLDLDSRILIEPCAVLIHAVERAKSTGILRFNSHVAVQGCGPIGLICMGNEKTLNANEHFLVPVGVSARHIHLTKEHVEILFGKGYQLTKKKELMGGQFASNEQVTIVGTKLRAIENVRVLGPARSISQVEISQTDAMKLGMMVPIRESGHIKDSAPISVVGSNGVIYLKEGCIIAKRHIHMNQSDAEAFGVSDGDLISVTFQNERSTTFEQVKIRVDNSFTLEMHLDTDEANASQIKTGDLGSLNIREGLIW